MYPSGPQLAQHCAEVLSLALCLEKQNPPNPITLAALRHAIQDLIAELQALDGSSQAGAPDKRP